MKGRLNARLDAESSEQISLLQRRTKQSISRIVRDAIRLYYETTVEASVRPFDVFSQNGFIGSGSGPKNLSADYKKLLHASLVRKTRP